MHKFMVARHLKIKHLLSKKTNLSNIHSSNNTIFHRKMKGETVNLVEVAPRSAVSRGVAILDFFLRLIALIGTLASAIAMGTTNQTLPFLTQFIRFRAKYSDLPSFTFFVVVNSVVSAYLVISLALSIFHIVNSAAQASRLVLIFFDTVALGLLSSGASAAAAIVYLAHKGNQTANWFAICRQYNAFCDRISGSLIGSFGGMVILILLIVLSAVAISRR